MVFPKNASFVRLTLKIFLIIHFVSLEINFNNDINTINYLIKNLFFGVIIFEVWKNMENYFWKYFKFS